MPRSGAERMSPLRILILHIQIIRIQIICVSPTSPRSRFGFAFVLLARRWRRLLDRRIAALGLTDATWTPLIHLQMAGDGISQTENASKDVSEAVQYLKTQASSLDESISVFLEQIRNA